MGNFGGDGEDGGGDIDQVSGAYHGEAGVKEGIHDVGDSQGGSSMESGGNPVRNDIDQKKTGYGGTVGGTAANFRGVHK